MSSLALAVGIYLPAEMGIGIILGNCAKLLLARGRSAQSHRGILTAAGLLTGDALFSLLAGLLVVFQFDMAQISSETPGKQWIGLAILFATLAFIVASYRQPFETDQ